MISMLFLFEQFRPPVDRYVIEFPAGLINDQKVASIETYRKAARRELLEETGYQARKIVKLVQGPEASGSSSFILTMVMACGLKRIHEGGGDDSESIRVHKVPLAKADTWLKKKERRGCLISPRLYAGLYFLNKYNK